MRKNNILSTSCIVLLGILLTACCACRKGSPTLANLEVDDWRLIEFRSEAVVQEQSIVLTFDPEKKMIHGKAPCNNFFSNYTLLDSKTANIQIGAGGATRKFCLNAAVEEGFVRMLPQVTRLQIEGDKLLMINAQGELVALLMAIPKTAL